MRMKNALYVGVAAVAIAVIWAGSVVTLDAQQPAGAAVSIDDDDIGGVVTGPNGPQAGVWGVAGTARLPTKFARVVGTGHPGRYVAPRLPEARDKVWGRGHGPRRSPEGE